MIFLDPAHFELHIVLSGRNGNAVAFSLRPVVAGPAPMFCEFLTENLHDPLRANVIAANDTILFWAPALDMRLDMHVPTIHYLYVWCVLAMEARKSPLGVCRDPVRCEFSETTYVYQQDESPGPRVSLSFQRANT